ncbi:MAG: hypothetical protein QXQ89_04530 [Ignisphaera sp.]|uniref:Uncharacterized protein n=2 Tax=Ignisphaera aggregans TaxID=334771 RepID=A0A832EVV3_9CREN
MSRRGRDIILILLTLAFLLTLTLMSKNYTYLELVFTLALVIPSTYLLIYTALSLYLGISFEPPIKICISLRGLFKSISYSTTVTLFGIAIDSIITAVLGRSLISVLSVALVISLILYVSRKVNPCKRIMTILSMSIAILIPLYLFRWIDEDIGAMDIILAMFEGG